MRTSIRSQLEDDHESLGQLLAELDAELAKPNIAPAVELLDLFWAHLAVHIRAENLHLFAALANVPASLFAGRSGLPTSEGAHTVLLRLRSDHDFFMKELAITIKAARLIAGLKVASPKETKELRQRFTTIAKRLEVHNLLEEEQSYVWPSLLFDDQTLTRLCDRVRHELENLPPRFS